VWHCGRWTIQQTCSTAEPCRPLLHALLPPSSTASQRYNLRHRAHSLQLPEHSTQLSESNFLTRMLYKNTYAQVLKFSSLFSRSAFFLLTVLPFCFELLACILSCRNKRILIDWLIGANEQKSNYKTKPRYAAADAVSLPLTATNHVIQLTSRRSFVSVVNSAHRYSTWRLNIKRACGNEVVMALAWCKCSQFPFVTDRAAVDHRILFAVHVVFRVVVFTTFAVRCRFTLQERLLRNIILQQSVYWSTVPLSSLSFVFFVSWPTSYSEKL